MKKDQTLKTIVQKLALIIGITVLPFIACVTTVPNTYNFSLKPSDLNNIQRFNHMPELHKGYRNVMLEVIGQDGNKTFMHNLIDNSNKSEVARAYVKEQIDRLHEIWMNDNSYGYLMLAKHLVSQFHQSISRDMGKGKLTNAHNVYPNYTPTTQKFNARVLPYADSIQTLEQFLNNRMEGNSYDFTVALVSMYEIARDIAKWKTFMSSDQFYRILYYELQRYQVIGLTVQEITNKRSICAVLTYTKDMSNVVMMPLDPQWAQKPVKRAFVNNGKFMSLVEKSSSSKFGSKKRVLWFFNSKFSLYRGVFNS